MTGDTKYGRRGDYAGRDFDPPEDFDDYSREYEARRGGRTQPARPRTGDVTPPPAAKRTPQHLTVPASFAVKPKKAPTARLASTTKRRLGELISFVLCVVVPLGLATIYFGYIASNQYVSEFRFSVKDNSTSANTGMSGVYALIGNTGTGVVTENYLVTDYLTSRQAVEDLEKRVKVIERFTRPEIDGYSRFDPKQPMENFVKYWQKMVSTNYDQVTGIATAQVRAFTPQDALLIANTMVTLSEELVNQIASRTRMDAVRFAENEVERAQERLRRVRTQLTDNRARAAGPNNDPNTGALLLDLERQVAQTMLTSAMQTYDQARANAAAQHLYITPYVRPSLPESSTHPRRFLSIAVVGLAAFAIWLIGLLTARSIFDRIS